MSRLLPADGRVAVAVATTGADAETCLAHARAAAAAGADVVELRADLLADPDPLGAAGRLKGPSRLEGPGRCGGAGRIGDVVGLAADVVDAAGGAPVLLTVRTAAEGGGAGLDDGAYSGLLHRLIKGLADLEAARRPAALDVEQARGKQAHGFGAVFVL